MVAPPIQRFLRETLAGAAVLLLAVLSSHPAAQARDGAVSPPTCVSIINAAVNCPARQPMGAIRNADAQLKAAEEQLAMAEKEAGVKLGLGESKNGEPELVSFWKAEARRLRMNREFLVDLRSELGLGGGSSTAGGGISSDLPRFVSRLAIVAPNVEQEVNFWCEALGMQRYAVIPGGGALVAFGPPELDEGDEGGFFGVEIRPSPPARLGNSGVLGDARLSFVQVATPSLIRISKVIASGGELIDGYGYYGIRSPAGVDVRAYVDDRRDPVELVALAAAEGEGVEAVCRGLEALGLKSNGPYELVSPETQGYMPEIPPGNMLYSGTVGGGPKQTVQVLVLPVLKRVEKSLLDQLPRGATLIAEPDGKYNLGALEREEAPETTISQLQRASIVVLSPSDRSSRLLGTAAPRDETPGVLLEVRSPPAVK